MSRREARRLERRAGILAVARDHFFREGYAATSMSAIAAELGGSKGTLWSYFPSKEELFAAVVDDTASGVQGELKFPSVNRDARSAIRRLCRSLVDRACSAEALSMMRLINAEGARFPEIARLFVQRGPQTTQRMIADYLADNFAAVLDTTDFVEAAQTLATLSVSGLFYMRLWGLGGSVAETEKDAHAHRAADLFLRAYGYDPERAAVEPRRKARVG